jgi:hypothetical protein
MTRRLKSRRHDCSAFDQMALKHRRLRKRVPRRAFLQKALVPHLLRLSDPALRVFLNRARFAGRRTASSYPKLTFLMRVLGCPVLYTCWYCGGNLYFRLDAARALKRDRHEQQMLSIIEAADQELVEARLQRCEVHENRYATYPGMRLTLPNGSLHQIPKNAPPGSFFIVPDSIFTTGSAAIWRRTKHGFIPVSSPALRLLVILLSEEHEERYGGVNPAVICITTNGTLRFDERRIALSAHEVTVGVEELLQREILDRQSCVISRLGGHLLRVGNDPTGIDELGVQILQVRRTGDLGAKRAVRGSLLVSAPTTG